MLVFWVDGDDLDDVKLSGTILVDAAILLVVASLLLVSLMTVVNMLPTAVLEGVVLLPESLLVLGGCRLEAVTVLAMLLASVLAVESETLNTVDAATLDDGSVLCDIC